MQRYIAVFICQSVRYQRELDLVGVQLAFIGTARLIEFVIQVAAVGVFLGRKDSSGNQGAFDSAVLAVGIAVVKMCIRDRYAAIDFVVIITTPHVR